MKFKSWEKLDISDDFLFGKVMRNPEICKKMIETILNIEIERIEYPEEQKVIDITAESKSVRLDVYVKDSKNTVYNIEMQPVPKDYLPKRSRYYQDMIDLELIEKGERYSKLNESYVIFICKFDLFGLNRYIYTFKNICEEDHRISLNDGTTKIFLNSKGNLDNANEDLKAFLTYVNTGKVLDNNFANTLHNAVKKARENKEWRREYMTLYMWQQEILDAGREEGLKTGREEGLKTGREEGLKAGREEGLKTGREEGLKTGHTEGDLLRLISQVRKKFAKGISASDAAEMLEEDIDNIIKIMSCFQANPEWTNEQVLQHIKQ